MFRYDMSWGNKSKLHCNIHQGELQKYKGVYREKQFYRLYKHNRICRRKL